MAVNNIHRPTQLPDRQVLRGTKARGVSHGAGIRISTTLNTVLTFSTPAPRSLGETESEAEVSCRHNTTHGPENTSRLHALDSMARHRKWFTGSRVQCRMDG